MKATAPGAGAAHGDPYDLQRFVLAQDAGSTYSQALGELRAGRKRSHWMWFVFPQLAGLGSSPMARRYAIADLDEAAAYLAHPVLGRRLLECAEVVAGLPGHDAGAVFGGIDALKLRSSVTLFDRVARQTRSARVAPQAADVFARVLGRYFDGQPDPATLARLPALE